MTRSDSAPWQRCETCGKRKRIRVEHSAKHSSAKKTECYMCRKKREQVDDD